MRTQLPSPKRGRSPPPIFGSCLLWPNSWMDQNDTWHRGGPRFRPHCARWGPSSPPQKGAQPPIFGPCLLWLNGWMDQDATWYEGRPRPKPHYVSERGTAAPPLFGPCLLWLRSSISAIAELLFSTFYSILSVFHRSMNRLLFFQSLRKTIWVLLSWRITGQLRTCHFFIKVIRNNGPERPNVFCWPICQHI